MAKSNQSNPQKENRRSVCPVACALDILGDKWTLLVVRDLILGKTRFKEFIESPEKIPTNILSERLERLVHHKIVKQKPISSGSKRMGYQLTEKGADLRPIAEALLVWGLKWEEGTEAKLLKESPVETKRVDKQNR